MKGHSFTPARASHFFFELDRASNFFLKQTNIGLLRLSCSLLLTMALSLSLTWIQWQRGHIGNVYFGVVVLAIGLSISTISKPGISLLMRCMGKSASKSQEHRDQKCSRLMRTAEFLLWLLFPREGRESAIGDTKETFEMVVERFGSSKARHWYWSEVAKSAWPLGCYLGKQLGKWCGLGALAEFLRRAL